MLYKLLLRFLTGVFSLLLAAYLIEGIALANAYITTVVALIMGLLNVTIRPILYVLTLPLTLVTFGLFALVINALLLWFVASFVDGFTVEGFVSAFLGAAVISLVGFLMNKLTR